ncbi:MAG TPA: SAF domain-containing protein [Anaerolineales bacterium]|nr:SAF domain-containing protein [Anaerolineales bacterium]
MRRGRIFIYLALILLLGVVAAVVIYTRFLQPAAATPDPASVTPVVDLVNVVVATQRIPRGSVMDESVLGVIDIQRDLMIEGYFTEIKQLVGRRARVDLEANMLITSGMVVDSAEQLSSTGSVAALSIPRGMVAVSIPINRLSAVSYAPQPGDHVNVIATLLLVDLDTDFQTVKPNQSAAVLGAGPGVLIGTGTAEGGNATLDKEINKITAQNATGGAAALMGRTVIDPVLEQTFYVVPSESQRPRLVSQVLLQDAIVLGVGDFPLSGQRVEDLVTQETVATEVAPIEGAPEEPAQAPRPPDVITLIVTPQDAVTLNYLIYAGAQLTLALRPAGDDSRVPTEAATLDFLLKNYLIPVPVPLPYGLEPRVDDLIPPELPNDAVPTPQP